MSSGNEASTITTHNPGEGVVMQRDMELVREIVRAIQNKADLRPEALDPGDHDPEVFGRHVQLLYQAGMIDGTISRPMNGPATVMVVDLTWSGHDFAAVGNQEVWDQVKKKVSAAELATMSLGAIKDVAQAVLASVVKKQLGLE